VTLSGQSSNPVVVSVATSGIYVAGTIQLHQHLRHQQLAKQPS
jgi:hypothetical protein